MFDSDDEYDNLLPRKQEETKAWDQFPDSARPVVSDSMAESKWYNYSLKLMHMMSFLVTFAVVLGAATISKGTLLFMTSQVSHKERKPFCNKDLDRNRQFVITLTDTERVAWIWMLFFAYCVPQLGTFFRSLRVCFFKKFTFPTLLDFALVVFTETLPAIGSALLVFCILPQIDVLKGAMLMNGICFVPGLMDILMRRDCQLRTSLSYIFDVISVSAQATAFIAWPLVQVSSPELWTIPVALLFISSGYWENYLRWMYDETDFMITDASVKDERLLGLARQRIFFPNTRYFSYIFVSLWKILVFFITMLLIFSIRDGDCSFLFDRFADAMSSHPLYIEEISPIVASNIASLNDLVATGMGRILLSDSLTPFWVFLINILSTYICYIFSKFACKILIQGFSFAFPLNLTMPVVISALVALCGTYARDECAYADVLPMHLFFDSPPLHYLEDVLLKDFAWIWLLWMVSQAWITRHIWTPSSERLARTERLFMRPMYDAFLIDQDIALNRRREAFTDRPPSQDDIKVLSDTTLYEDVEGGPDNTTRIFACGTMWHETKDEMMAFLKSILRLDADQCARKIAWVKFQIEKDFYELETHVFFDDAFVRYDTIPGRHLNDYVKLLISTMDEARREVHKVDVVWPGPTKIATPYGGRLMWKLPGGSNLIAHLKDKKRIRAKKRWSQVMYMYYLLGHRLMDGNFSEESKDVRAENTYILALDGDIDFQPQAVLLLVDLMKRSKSVGAACGRIHPIGSGPMVWYQIFEYAIGHWLQKATEHVIGCVLCSPGCFSLFRGSALMTDNVMKRYTTESTSARHFVQYDQGEDRWLCTLLLQRGFRVEYSAASDAYTHCPEGFNEFYNQRRRWMPSTTANIMDLLMDYKYLTHTNDNISMLYIFYQGIMMLGTVLGPGTIFLMLVGAFVAAFQIDQWTSFLWNAVPILLFMAICKLFKKASVQLFFAGILSAIYGLVMMAVFVGILLQIRNDGVLAPSSLFFFFTAGEMIITAIMHPKEFGCLMYGVIYYVTVPSMYLLLVIYSIFNMNVISWGTRETVIVSNPDDAGASVQAKKKKGRVWNFLGDGDYNSGAISVSIASLFKCFLCTNTKSPEEERLIAVQKSLEAIQTKLGMIEKEKKEQELVDKGQEPIVKIQATHVVEDEDDEEWMDEGKTLMRCRTEVLDEREKSFWVELVKKYLQPDVLDDKSTEKQKIKKDLEDLRDKSVLAFFMLNALFVLVIFMLTLKKDVLHVSWPFNVKTNFSYFPEKEQIEITKQYLELEPIGFVFVIFFGILMVVQFIAMFQHRFETMCQILANMEFQCSFWGNQTSDLSERRLKGQRAIEAIKDAQRLDAASDCDTIQGGARKTVYINSRLCAKNKNAKLRLWDAFNDNVMHGNRLATTTRQTMIAMQRRRTEIFGQGANDKKDDTSTGHENKGFTDF